MENEGAAVNSQAMRCIFLCVSPFGNINNNHYNNDNGVRPY